jgi:hypothetical protein
MKPHEELDKLIDTALAGYSSTEPKEGLEGRILRRVEAAGPARWRGWGFRFAVAGQAVAALLLAAFAVRMWQPEAAPMPQAPPAALKPPVTLVRSPQATPSKTMSATRRHRVRPRGLPKDERFPAPAPLTPEEHALLAWARRAPIEAREAFAALRAQVEDPVTIAPIQIPPIRGEKAQ